MRRSSRLFFAALLLASPASLTARPMISVAAAAILSPDQVAAFRAKLDAAKAGQGALAKRADCLGGYVLDLQKQSAERERALGDARRREQELSGQVARFEQDQRGFSQQVDAETRNYNSKREEYDRALSKYREQESRLSTCSSFLGRSICKWGEDAVKATGIMDDARREFESTDQRLKSALRGLSEVRNRLNASERELSQARSDAAFNQKAIADLEGQIASAKAANAGINVKIQEYNSKSVEIDSTLRDAGEVDPNDAIRRQVERLSSDVDAFTSGIPAFAATVDLGLPEDARARCPR